MLSKPRSQIETPNDLNERANAIRWTPHSRQEDYKSEHLATDDLERASRLMVCLWQSKGQDSVQVRAGRV